MINGVRAAITKCGNAHARWLLVECAQHYATPPKVSKELSRRQEGQQPHEVRAISWRAQNRLHGRFARLSDAPAPAQQGDGGDRAGALRLYLGTLAHAILLPGQFHIPLKRWFEGNSY